MILLVLLAMTSGVAIALGLMVVGLFEAPWPVLLSLLFLGFLSLQRLTAHASNWDADGHESTVSATQTSPQARPQKQPSTPAESSAEDDLTFTYRGIKYHRSAAAAKPADEQPAKVEGVYRGQHWQRLTIDPAKQLPPASDTSTELKYRGHRVKK